MLKKKGKKTRGRAALHVILPATSANLGPAFDAAALAMDLYLTIDARPAPVFSITASGRDAEICRCLENHLILSTYSEILQAHGAQVIPLSLSIKNDIPIGKGCGSSAAARLAGIALANHFGHLRWTDAQIIGEASRREHHPDNASACWMGGLTVARMSGEAEAQVVCIRPKGSGLCFLPFLAKPYPPKKLDVCCPRSILVPMPLRTYKTRCSCWPLSRKAVTTCSPPHSKTGSISLTALPCALCCRV